MPDRQVADRRPARVRPRTDKGVAWTGKGPTADRQGLGWSAAGPGKRSDKGPSGAWRAPDKPGQRRRRNSPRRHSDSDRPATADRRPGRHRLSPATLRARVPRNRAVPFLGLLPVLRPGRAAAAVKPPPRRQRCQPRCHQRATSRSARDGHLPGAGQPGRGRRARSGPRRQTRAATRDAHRTGQRDPHRRGVATLAAGRRQIPVILAE